MLTLIVADLPEKLKLPSILTITADKKCGCKNSKLRVSKSYQVRVHKIEYLEKLCVYLFVFGDLGDVGCKTGRLLG